MRPANSDRFGRPALAEKRMPRRCCSACQQVAAQAFAGRRLRCVHCHIGGRRGGPLDEPARSADSPPAQSPSDPQSKRSPIRRSGASICRPNYTASRSHSVAAQPPAGNRLACGHRRLGCAFLRVPRHVAVPARQSRRTWELEEAGAAESGPTSAVDCAWGCRRARRARPLCRGHARAAPAGARRNPPPSRRTVRRFDDQPGNPAQQTFVR